MKKIYSYWMFFLPISLIGQPHDYNENIISQNKIIFNNNTTNSHIQSIMQKTVNFDGLLDQTFGSNREGALGTLYLNSRECNSIVIQADGKIVMGGVADVNNTNRFAAARLNSDGSSDTSFGNGGSVYLAPIASGSNNDQCYSLAIQNDGKIVMGGFTRFNNTDYRFAVARLINPMALQNYQVSYSGNGIGTYS